MKMLAAYFVAFTVIMVFSDCKSQVKKGGDYYAYKRKKMVEDQIIARGVKDEKVIAAMLKVPRHEFVPDKWKDHAYEDHPLPIGFGQTISQPYIVASMTEVLDIKKSDKVFEVGTGSGYQAAVLAELAGTVYTIEIVKELAERAQDTLKRLGYRNITVKHGDGYKGMPEFSPFDAIIVTAAPPEIPEELVKQLKMGGRMVLPLGEDYQELVLIKKTEKGIEKKILYPVRFVPMIKGKE